VGGEAAAVMTLPLLLLFVPAGATAGVIARRKGWARVRPLAWAVLGGILLPLHPVGWAVGGAVGGIINTLRARPRTRLVRRVVCGALVGAAAWAVVMAYLFAVVLAAIYTMKLR
jgi:hypothetical protein